jgi:hypothetical protein
MMCLLNASFNRDRLRDLLTIRSNIYYKQVPIHHAYLKCHVIYSLYSGQVMTVIYLIFYYERGLVIQCNVKLELVEHWRDVKCDQNSEKSQRLLISDPNFNIF